MSSGPVGGPVGGPIGSGTEPPVGWVESVIDAPGAPSTRRRHTRRAAASLKAIGDHLLQSAAPDELLADAADRLEALVAELESAPGPPREPDPGMPVDTNPHVGLSNHVAPPLRFEPGPRPLSLRARVRYGAAYQGPPGCVHGGQIAAFFDELLASCQTMVGPTGVTGQLTVRYLRPTPLHTDLVGEAEPVEPGEGRKRFVRGRLMAPDGTVTAEAEAVVFPFPAGELPRA